MTRSLSLTMLLFVVTAGSAQADDEADDYAFEVRSAPLGSIEDAAGAATAIDTSDSDRRVQQVSELMEQSAGVSIRRLGGLGSFATVGIRGSSASQVLVLLDGVPLSSGAEAIVDVDLIPPDFLSRIEVFRSGAPIWLGAPPMGGVVHLVTRRSREFGAVASVSGGSFWTRRATAVANGTVAAESALPLELLAGIGYLGSEGDFTFHDDRGTPYNTDDDHETERINNRFDRGTVLLRAGLRPSATTRVSVLETALLEDRGVPGLGQFQSDATHLDRWRSLTQISVEALSFPASWLDSRARVYLDMSFQDFDDREGDTGLGRREIETDNRSVGGHLHLAAFPFEWFETHASFEGRGEAYASHDLVANSGALEATRTTLSSSLQTLFTTDIGLSLMAGGRADWSSSHQADLSNDDLLVTGQLGLKLTRDLGDTDLTVWSTGGRFSRLPTFVEMFGDNGAVTGNDALLTESALGADAGLRVGWEGEVPTVEWSVSGFYYRYEDLIQFVQNSQRVARPENIAAAEVVGAESSVTVGLWATVWLSASYTLTDATDTSGVAGQDGNQLPGRPRHSLNTSLSGEWRSLEAGYRLDFESSNILDRAGFEVVPERLYHSAHLGYSPAWAAGWSLTGEVRNVTDNRVEVVPVLPQPAGVEVTTPRAVSDYLGFPLPGRTFYVTLRWGVM